MNLGLYPNFATYLLTYLLTHLLGKTLRCMQFLRRCTNRLELVCAGLLVKGALRTFI